MKYTAEATAVWKVNVTCSHKEMLHNLYGNYPDLYEQWINTASPLFEDDPDNVCGIFDLENSCVLSQIMNAIPADAVIEVCVDSAVGETSMHNVLDPIKNVSHMITNYEVATVRFKKTLNTIQKALSDFCEGKEQK